MPGHVPRTRGPLLAPLGFGRVGTLVAGQPDIVAPVTVFVSETVTKVSAVTGFATTDITWSADENCQGWQIRDVTGAAGQTVADGTLIASGGAISANVSQTTT